MPRRDNVGMRRRLAVLGVLLTGLCLLVASNLLRSVSAWWSGTLDNVGVVVLLLIPGEFALTHLRSRLQHVARGVDRALATSEAALTAASEAKSSLAEVRAVLIARQRDEHEEGLEVYKRLVTEPSRDGLIQALREATDAGLLTHAGVRVPVWETNLHYRFVLKSADTQIIVQLEVDDGSLLSSHEWSDGTSSGDFLQILVEAVRSAGGDIGVGLNDPTESLEQLSEMLVQVVDLRAQELTGLRQNLQKIVERRNGWYFTEDSILPAENLHYVVAVSRLSELDWEQHLQQKGWYDAPSALAFARRLYNVPGPS